MGPLLTGPESTYFLICCLEDQRVPVNVPLPLLS